MTDEGDLNEYLGIKMERLENGGRKLSQPTLIRRILNVVNVAEERPKGRSLKRTPATKVLTRDVDGPERILKWDYHSVLGMLNWLTRSTRPDIGFAVSQAARFMAFPKRTHEAAVIRICEYLRDTKDEGLFLQPDNSGFKVWADADFSGGFDRSNPDDSSTAKSRSAYHIMFNVCVIYSQPVEAAHGPSFEPSVEVYVASFVSTTPYG
jgi:hypothetical protein